MKLARSTYYYRSRRAAAAKITTTTAGLLSSPANAEALGKLGGSRSAVALPVMIDRKRLTFFHYSKHIK